MQMHISANYGWAATVTTSDGQTHCFSGVIHHNMYVDPSSLVPTATCIALKQATERGLNHPVIQKVSVEAQADSHMR